MDKDLEELLAGMLGDLADASGVPLEDIMASEFEDSGDFVERDVYEEETESEEMNMDNDYGDRDIDDYLDDLVDDYDVGDSEDSYGDEAL